MKDGLYKYWNDIPVGKENAITYGALCELWQCSRRIARKRLHELSRYDNGDNYILIRSCANKGFYRTDNESDIKAYKRECLSMGRNVFAPIKKINRVLTADVEQYSFENNMRVIRETRLMTQNEVCKEMRKYDKAFHKSLLSKMENSVIMPTPYHVVLLAQIYGVEPLELLDVNLYY